MREGRYEFAGAAVLALLAESDAASERLRTEAQRYLAAGVDLHASPDDSGNDADVEPADALGAPPGLWLMNDRGVYLRSNARRRDPDHVAYAAGFRADVPVGGEPVQEFIDAAPLRALLTTDTLVVTLTERTVRLSVLRS